MGGIIDWLSGASSQAGKTAGQVGNYYGQALNTSNNAYGTAGTNLQAAYANALPNIQAQYANSLPGIASAYTNAANASNAGYTDAEGKLIDATGSPAAAQFAALQAQGLAPAFAQQQAALPGELAASGLTGSGAGVNALGLLNSGQSAALAQADAPLYANAESQYGNLLGAGAGANTNIAAAGAGATANQIAAGANAAGNFIGQGTDAYGNLLGQGAAAASGIAGSGASAQGQTYTNTYNQGISDFYGALQGAGADLTGNPRSQPAASIPTSYTPYAGPPGVTTTQPPASPGGSAPIVNYNPYGDQPSPTQDMPPANYNPYQTAA
jgi:hypothetical protein